LFHQKGFPFKIIVMDSFHSITHSDGEKKGKFIFWAWQNDLFPVNYRQCGDMPQEKQKHLLKGASAWIVRFICNRSTG
ncbi:MAG: hypothetical protein IJW85_02085, partial [Clostridia bacterium]|nr:hypothetical protein [Clostridia bacterium]